MLCCCVAMDNSSSLLPPRLSSSFFLSTTFINHLILSFPSLCLFTIISHFSPNLPYFPLAIMSAFDCLPFGHNCVSPSFVLFSVCFCASFLSVSRAVGHSSSPDSESPASELSPSAQFGTSRPSPPLFSSKFSSLLPPGDVQCLARPSDCSLDCPGGFEGTFDSNGQLRCLCQCRLPILTTNCQAFSLLLCRSDESCTTQNGQIKCVPAMASNADGPFSVSVSSSHQQKPPAVLPVNVVPLRPFLSIRPLGKHWPKGRNEQKYAEKTKSEETNAVEGGRRTEEDRKRGQNPCEDITCDESPLHMCQLVESNCEKQPKKCPPMPKCLINPCPLGTPVRLPSNGVTALCRTDRQCLDGWCHKIGYNGLGFCCPLPIPSLIKKGQCEAKETKKRTMAWELKTNCTAECRSDSDCASPSSKCCFDGCGMSCQLTEEKDGEEKREKRIEETGHLSADIAGGEVGEAKGTIERPFGEAKGTIERPFGEAKGTIERPFALPKRAEVPSAECSSLRDHPTKCEETTRNECLGDRNCAGESKCCSDGCSFRCIRISSNISNLWPNEWDRKSQITEREQSPIETNIGQISTKRVRHLANCPLRSLNVSSADCASNCASDADCARRSSFLRCCPFGCGMQCQFGDKLTPCVHQLATNLREVDKLVKVPKSVGRPTVQCTEEGHFEKVQFDPLNGQFWCVHPLTGIESVGSRVSASPLAPISPPDCTVRHFCKFNCSSTVSNDCPHGLRMDHRGCPLDERCQCRNPCEDFKCSFPEKEICLLKVVECVDDSFCPPIPICVENVCGRFGSQSVGDFVCSTSSDCQMQLANTDKTVIDCKLSNFPTDQIGICCASSPVHLFKEQSVKSEEENSHGKTLGESEGKQKQQQMKQKMEQKMKQGLCPAEFADGTMGKGECSADLCSSDADCVGIQKCCAKSAGGCRQCVQPILTTNCLNLLSAVLSLDATQIKHFVPKPNCDPKTGAFSRIQCDAFGWCWCVRSVSSASPLLGTRLFQPTDGEMFCETPKVCPLRQCSVTFCPFGVDFDSDGCPLSSECRCHNPCDQIQCPIGQICLLRERDCLEAEHFPSDFVGQIGNICLPVPNCEPSPCDGALKPLLNAALLVVQKCQLNPENNMPLSSLPQCPGNFQCIRQREYNPTDTTPEGICCPWRENEKNGDGAVEKMDGEHQIDENGTKKADFCHFPLHQGNGMAQCGENRSELRYFYDSQMEKCKAFLFSGCGGNSNNFKSKSECEKKCEKTESFEIGFAVDTNDNFQTMEKPLRDYLRKAFDLTEGQIRKVRFDYPTEGQVQFAVAAPNARQKAKRISETLAIGQFQFPLDDGHLVKAQSDGWWARRKTDEEAANEAEEKMQTEHIPLFWVLFLFVAIFAFVVLLVPCCAFLFLRIRPRHSFGRDSAIECRDSFSSPSPRVRTPTRHNWSSTANQRKDGISTTPTVLMEEAEEHFHSLRMRTTAMGDGDGMPSRRRMRDDHLPIPSSAAVTSPPSPAASLNVSTHFGNRTQQIIAPRILAERGEEEEEIRRGERTSTRTTWRWRT